MNRAESLLDAAPIWLIAPLFFIVLMAAFAGGRFLGRRSPNEPGAHLGDNHVLTAMLALLGLLIAFTFSLAVTRHDARRQAVIVEGNAISTLWLRASLVQGSQGDALRSAVRDYAAVRASLPSAADRERIELDSAKMQTVIWKRAREALPDLSDPLGAILITATTEVFDAAASRQAEREARIPIGVLDMVSLFAIITTAVLGYVLADVRSRRHKVISSLQLLLLSLALTLILDLDRPWSGSIRISGKPVADAFAAMK